MRGVDRRGRRSRLVRERAAAASTTTAAPPPVPTTTTPSRRRTNAALPWPTYGADNARPRAVAAPGLRPPFRRLWTFHGHALLEFPPVVGYGSVFEESFDGRLHAIDPASGRVRWSYTSHRCGWSSPALADASPLRDLHRQPGVQGDAGRRRDRRVLADDRPRPLAPHDRPVGVVAARRERHGLRRRPGRIRLRLRRRRREPALALRHRRADQGVALARVRADLHRQLRRRDVRPRRAHGPTGLAERRARQLLLHRLRQRRPRLRRLARRPRLRVLGPRPATSSGASGRAATSTPRRPSGTASSSSARTTTPSTRSTAAPARSAGRITRGRRSPAPPRSSTASSTSRASTTGRTRWPPRAAACARSGRTASTRPRSPANGRLYLVGLGRIYALTPAAR